MNDELRAATQDLWRWARGMDFQGHDPHNMLESPVLRWLPNASLRLIALQLGRRSPVNLRPILGVRKSENPKALALFLAGLESGKAQVTADWMTESDLLAYRLLSLQDSNGGWGYPFAWQSRTHYVPKDKPNIVTTAFCGLALSSIVRRTGNTNFVASLERAVNYVLTVLPRSTDGVAFGYAEDDRQIVFNASLLGGQLLAEAGNLLQRSDLINLAHEATDFVVKHQRPDGSWIYGLKRSQNWIDSFHTGFVIDSLFSIGEICEDSSVKQAAERGLQYYQLTFLQPDGPIRYFPGNKYPIDAHVMGQGISLLAKHGFIPEADRSARWACENLRSRAQGYFYYQKHAAYTNRIAYMRWSNAWMFKGLCDLLSSQ
jgi:hypothetical protein